MMENFKEFVPLFQTLVWPIFVSIFILIFWKNILGILEAIRQRIETGDTFEAGPGGIKLGRSVTHTETENTAGVEDKAKKTIESKIETPLEGKTRVRILNVAPDEPKNPGIYLAHKVRRDKSLDRGEYQYYRLRIFLETEKDVNLGCVSHVTYHLHPSFRNPDRTVRDPNIQFEINTAAWGQFNLTAEVYLKGHDKPIYLERYLNF